jgi:hypothetical protein
MRWYAQRFGAFCPVADDRRRISFGPFTFAQMHVVDAAQLGDPAPDVVARPRVDPGTIRRPIATADEGP